MKRLWLLILSVWLLMPSVAKGADKSVADTISAKRAFIEMPTEVLSILPKNVRLDMLDYLAIDSIYNATNILGGKSYIEKFDSTYMKLQITKASTLEIRILPLKNGSDVVAAIYTVGDSVTVADSRLYMFDASMKPLKASNYFKSPSLKDFIKLPSGASMSYSEVESMIPFLTMRYDFKLDTYDMSVAITSLSSLPLETVKAVQAYIVPTLEYEWNGKIFKLKK
jgi:hypothetical protein